VQQPISGLVFRHEGSRGLADVATTKKYFDYVERPDEAHLIAEAFALDDAEPENEKDRLGGRSNPGIGRAATNL
jgi:hypothetical protein